MDDLISRQAAIDAFYKCPNIDWTTLDVLAKIKELPSAERRGKWERVYPSRRKSYLRFCTACREQCWYCGTGDYNYCPNCGARMEDE